MTVSLDSTVQRNPQMMFTDLDDAVVMMDADKGMYYELDPVGARIWTLLATERSVKEICALLVAEFDVTPEACRDDVREFLEKAQELGIVAVAAPAASSKRRAGEA